MNILIFTSKFVGLKTVYYLIENHKKDDYTFVLTEENDQPLIDLLNSHKKKFFLVEEFFKNLNPDQTYDWLLNLWGNYIFKDKFLKKIKHILFSYLVYYICNI